MKRYNKRIAVTASVVAVVARTVVSLLACMDVMVLRFHKKEIVDDSRR